MSLSPKIDLHSHWFSPRIRQLLLNKTSGIRFIQDQHKIFLDRQKIDALPQHFELGHQWFDIPQRIEHLQQHQIIHQLLSWPTTLEIDALISQDESRFLSQTYNDDLAKLVQQYPEQFSALAYLSTSDLNHAQQELVRAHDELNLIGAVLPVGIFSTQHSSQQLKELLSTANELGSHIYLHTGFGHPNIHGQVQFDSSHASKQIHLLNTSYVFSSAIFTLLYTDILDAYPNVSIQIAMLGGGSSFAPLLEQFKNKPERYGHTSAFNHRLNQLTFDTGASGDGTVALETLVKIIGSQHIVFGTDYAPQPSVEPVINNIEAANLTSEQKQQIYFQNANLLLQRQRLSKTSKTA